MKKSSIITLILVISSFLCSAQMAYFTKSSAPLTGYNSQSDSVYVEQTDVVSIQEISSGGSELIYFKGNVRSSVNVREQVGDSAWTFATFLSTFSSNAALDSITIGGTNVTPNGVPVAGSLTATLAAIRDSISVNSATDTAIATATTLTFRKIADSTATPNGTVIVIYYQGTVSPSSGTLTGGFYRRNASYIYGAATQLFEVTSISNSNELLINKTRVSALNGDAPTTIWYHGAINDSYEVSENRSVLTTTINALP